MLARHAEDLLWIGRYLERAEDTARLLDVTYHTTLEARDDETAHEAWHDLAEVLYLEEETADLGQDALARFLVLDTVNSGSIVAAVSAKRAAARCSAAGGSMAATGATMSSRTSARSMENTTSEAAEPSARMDATPGTRRSRRRGCRRSGAPRRRPADHERDG